MGHGIAQLFAVGGYEVALMDKFPEMLEKAKVRIRSSLDRSVERGRLTKEQSDAAYSRISFTGDLGVAVMGAGLVVEAVPESPELKKSVLKEASEKAPADAILASNTSNIRISDLAGAVRRPDRVVGMHFFNPPTAMKLVEVIPGSGTDPAVLTEVSDICAKLGRTPIRVLKDSPGFIVNRINAADTLFFCLVLDKGVATPPEVDSFARSQGLPMGPYELLDFVGIDIGWDSLTYFSRALSPEYGKGVTFGKMVQEKRLGKKTGRGFYDWSMGRADVPQVQATDKISIMDIFALEINEAVKLVEEGVARPDDIEKAVTLGMNRPFGPIAVAKDLSNAEVKAKLEGLAKTFDCAIFAPARSISEGKLRDAIEGRVATTVEGAVTAQPAVFGAPPTGANISDAVRLERLGGGVAKVVLNRPRLNLINADVLDRLDAILGELAGDPETRVIVMTGEGNVLSAGADLSQYFGNTVSFTDFMRKGQRTFRKLAESPKLTLAVMKGYALGGGLELALNCDLRVATEDVEMGLPELTRGLAPGWTGTQRLAQLVGLSVAASIVLASERIKGRRAAEIGLVHRLVSSGDADEFAVRYAGELASTQAPVALAMAKRLINKATEVPADVGLEMEALAAGVLFGTEDLKEGASAFLGKRKPEFKGK